MADILLIHSPDKKGPASRLAEAIGSAGYSVRLEQVDEPDGAFVVEQAKAASAALLIWSRPLVSSAVLNGWLGRVRLLPNLIEISTDGISPQSRDEGRVVLLSGWRGQPFHLGWQRILEELKRLCGARKAAPQAAPAAAPSAAAQDKAPTRGSAGREAGPRRWRAFAIPAIAAAALAGAVGAATWIGTGPQPRSEPKAPAAVAAERSVARPGPVVPAAVVTDEAGFPRAASPASAPPPPEGAQPTVTSRPRPAAAKSEQARSLAARAGPPAPRRSAAARAEAPLKRYSKKRSKTMRLFCERSGRSTPECRTFLRSTGGTNRSPR